MFGFCPFSILVASVKNHLHIPILLGMSKKLPVVFEFLRPQENVTPYAHITSLRRMLEAGQNPSGTKIPIPLRAGNKNTEALRWSIISWKALADIYRLNCHQE